MLLRAIASLIVMLAAGSVFAQQPGRTVPTDRAQVVYSYAPIVKKVTPAVVNVYAQRVEQRQARNPLLDDPFFRQFFGQQPQRAQSLGSGVIVDSAGLVVTNNHVVEGMTEVKVALGDRREIEAEIVLRDPRTDLAVLRLKGAKNLSALDLGDSDQLEVGDLVLAVGNPFAVGQTVTQGIVSALARTQVGITDYGFFIQTDAAINPGNSGGALVDMEGRLVGINTAIYSRSGGSVGIGFAIPVNMVKAVVRAAKGDGKLRRPWLGATLQNVTREIAESLGMDRPAGALVSNIIAASPAERGGLRRGDVIVAIDGLTVDDMQGLGYRLATKTLGDSSVLSVMRGNRKTDVSIKLEAAPENPPREEMKISGPSPFAGITIVNFSPAIGEEITLHESVTQGVVVSAVEEGSVAAQVGLQKGDVIVAINDTEMKRTRDVRQATQSRRSYWKITIGRDGQVLNTVLGG